MRFGTELGITDSGQMAPARLHRRKQRSIRIERAFARDRVWEYGMKRFQAIFFDVDGVLLNSLDLHLRFCEEKNREYGLGLKIPTAAEFKKVARERQISPMKHFLMAVGFQEQDANRADADYQREFTEKYHPLPFPHVFEMLSRLHDAGLTLGLVTSNVKANVERALGDAWKLFDPNLCFTLDHQDRGSKAQALEAGTKQLGLSPNQVLYVGDQISDLHSAREAGIPFLGVTFGWGLSREDGLCVANDHAEIEKYILRTSGEIDEYLKVGLEHGRSMFVYHAGQRHSSLNFYFAVLAAFVAAFAALFTHDELWKAPGNVAPTIAFGLAVAAMLLTFFFLLLDFRNRDLVKCDELLIDAIEIELARQYSLPKFKIIEKSNDMEHTGWGAPFISYKWIVPLILFVFAAIWAGVIIESPRYYEQVRYQQLADRKILLENKDTAPKKDTAEADQAKGTAATPVAPATGQKEAVGDEAGKKQ